jgi:glycosyltransferase involved in cell wall biosynthesis
MTGDIVIAHKDYDVRGGGEVLAEEIARTFDAPLVVGRRDEACEPDNHDLDIREIDLRRWQQWAIDRGGMPRSLAYQVAWQVVPELTDYDTVITSGNEPLWYVPEDDQTVVAYTHSPPRFQYDLYQRTYNPDTARLGGIVGTLYGTAVRTLYQHNVTRPDLYVANSDRVARRINQYWNIPRDQIRVVYPPVQTDAYSPSDANTGDYYLYLGRLAGHKCVDEVVEAFNELGSEYRLVVAGRGPEGDSLRELADDHIEFRGFVDEEEKRELYAGAKALVYPPENEDFGMVPIEAMAAGTPVIGVKEGFTQHQILNERNGYTYSRAGGHLRETIRYYESNGVEWTPEEIAEFAGEHFSVAAFQAGMRDAVLEAQDRASVSAPWEDQRGQERPIPDPERVEARPDGGNVGDSS